MFDEVCYRKNYVAEVICRLDFATPIDTLKNSMPKAVYDVVKKYYPIAEPQNVIGTELQITPLTGAAVNQVITKQWVFLSRNRLERCTISSENIIFSVRKYNTFEDIRKAILDVLQIVMESFPENQGKRLGLRYINDLPPEEHSAWINQQFFAALTAHRNDKTTRLVTTFEYAVPEEDLVVRLQYGYLNPDYPSVLKRRNFIIDVDAYSVGIIYREDLADFIDNMHLEDQKCFEMMITDDFRKAANTGD